MFLKMEHCSVFYGQVQALYDVSIEINEGDFLAIIGANGAGKSTLMKSIMNLAPDIRATIEYQGEQISRMPTHDIVARGISYIPEGREVFPNMTVLENLEMGAYKTNYSRKQMNEKIGEMYDLFPRLRERKSQKAGTLSGGEQQMLAVGRGLMLSPKLLMCDEPSLGLAPIIVDGIFDILVRINKQLNLPILLVEQNAYMALTVSNRCYVLENGAVVKHGLSAELLRDDGIRRAYLGK
jgi:branched-chain amino acid transport system ATP-binding protein